jgi:hypothetical protein
MRRELPVWSVSGDVTSVPLALEPSGSMFIVFRAGEGPAVQAAGAAAHTAAYDPAANDPEWQPVLDVPGPWQVSFASQAPATFDSLVDWTTRPEPEIRHFSGTAVYRVTVNVPDSVLASSGRIALDLGVVREMVAVRLNGKSLGTVWCAPWRVDVTEALRPGENVVEIDVVNLWRNRLIGDAARPAAERVTTTTLVVAPTEPLLPSGLLGPVRLVRAAPIEAARGTR